MRTFDGLPTVTILQAMKNVTVYSTFPNLSPGYPFLTGETDKRARMEQDGTVTVFHRFSLPSPSKIAMIPGAMIGHLEMHQHLPMILNDDNLEFLTELTESCTINKLSLAFDENALANMCHISAIVARCRVRHVEFIFANVKTTLNLAPNLNSALAFELARFGVRAVTFSGTPIQAKEQCFFNLFARFFEAGIVSITVNPKAIFKGELSQEKLFEDENCLIEILSKLRRPLSLQLHALLDDGRATSEQRMEKKMNGMRVRICEKPPRVAGETSTVSISIE